MYFVYDTILEGVLSRFFFRLSLFLSKSPLTSMPYFKITFYISPTVKLRGSIITQLQFSIVAVNMIIAGSEYPTIDTFYIVKQPQKSTSRSFFTLPLSF